MRLALPCGCPVIVHHEKGDRRVVCEGGGLTGGPVDWEECPGGRSYAVHAQEITTTSYVVRALHVVEEAS